MSNKLIDKGQIKGISILSVAEKLGISIKRNHALCYNNHDKKTPSLSFNDKKNVFHCFGCNDGGDSITLVQNVLKIDFYEALAWFNENYTIYASKRTASRVNKRRTATKIAQAPAQGFLPNPSIYRWIIDKLELTKEAKLYLCEERGFPVDLLEQLEVRSFQNCQELKAELLKNWDVDELLHCGLFKIDHNNSRRFVWWDSTVLFPFFDKGDNITYIQGRRMSSGDPRYVNLNGVTPSLYNSKCLEVADSSNEVFVCEGITDTITAIQHGYLAVGVLGANGFKPEWVQLFKDTNVTVVPDGDQGGVRFVNNVRRAFKEIGKPVRSVVLPKGHDLNSHLNAK
jgi:DNA primase